MSAGIYPLNQEGLGQALSFSVKAHQNSLKNQEIASKFNKVLTDYSENNQDFSSLTRFANETLSKKNRIQEIKEGWSGDRVYRVSDVDTQKPLAILKVYKKTSNNFFPEVYALQYLDKVGFNNAPKINALGQYRSEAGNAFILSESVAPGHSLLDIVRNSNFETLLQGVHACGRSLGKLHRHRVGNPITFTEKSSREYLAKAIERLRRYPQDGIDISKLTILFEKTISSLKSKKVLSGLAHGDVNLANVFYDPESNEVTWIDLPRLAESLDSLEQPIGIPGKDFCSFITDLEHHYSYSFERAKIRSENGSGIERQDACCESSNSSLELSLQKLKEAFASGYVEEKGILPTKEECDFYSFSTHLFFIAGTGVLASQELEPVESEERYRISHILENLRTRN